MPPPKSPQLSKSKYTTGLQCHLLLWLKTHERNAPELAIGPAQQAIFDQGNRVGNLARSYVPGGTLIQLSYGNLAKSIAATRDAIAAGANTIYEASFREDDVFVAVDILHRPSPKAAWTLTEVKSTTKVKDEHYPDAAVQMHVVKRAGLKLKSVELMHLSRECRFPDLSNLFARTDITASAEGFIPQVPAEVQSQLVMLARSKPPKVEVGDHCKSPHECPFISRCWAKSPARSIDTLYNVRGKKLDSLKSSGYTTILDLPEGLDINEIAERQRRAVRSNQVVVEKGLKEVLAKLKAPIAHFDFETINPAIPVWAGCRPYDQVPVQFSAHIESASGKGEPKHIEWLAEGTKDPRPEIARALVDALRGAQTIMVFHAQFESDRLKELKEAVPGLAAELGSVMDRLVDLLPIVRDNVYHPDFNGSFSLKSVAPALVPDLQYEGMEIADGGAASAALETYLLRSESMTAETRAKTRKNLFAYCRQDTLATLRILQRLRAFASR